MSKTKAQSSKCVVCKRIDTQVNKVCSSCLLKLHEEGTLAAQSRDKIDSQQQRIKQISLAAERESARYKCACCHRFRDATDHPGICEDCIERTNLPETMRAAIRAWWSCYESRTKTSVIEVIRQVAWRLAALVVLWHGLNWVGQYVHWLWMGIVF